MKITGIIAEYNPFHKGHEYMISKIKQSSPGTFVVAVMSGNFVQRGEAALFDKFTRTRLALLGGADIVIELPVCFALQSADGFASGGTRILNTLGCVDELCFGSESGDTKSLIKTAEVLSENSQKLDILIKEELEKGISFGAAKLNAGAKLSDNDAVLKYPNDMLGIEYIRSLIKINSAMDIKTVRRIGPDHADSKLHSGISSASAIRKALSEGIKEDIMAYIPESCAEEFKTALKSDYVSFDSLYPLISYILRQKNPEAIADIQGVSEGLENKLIAAALDSSSGDEFLSSVISKRYTKARIKRALMSVLLNITKNDIAESQKDENLYAHILGLKKDATKVLSEISKHSSIPVITKAQDIDENNPLMKKDILASDIYFLATRQRGRKDHINKLIII